MLEILSMKNIETVTVQKRHFMIESNIGLCTDIFILKDIY